MNLDNLTILIAHPDDEVIFGWMVLQKAKKIICCSNDKTNNSLYPNWIHRESALRQIGKILNIPIICLNYNSGFYTNSNIIPEIQEAIKNEPFIFTHNEWGEYGNKDHQLVHEIAKQSGKPIIVSNIYYKKTQLKYKSIPLGCESAEFKNDIKFYNKCKEIYTSCDCWTWQQPYIEKAKCYLEE